jgi:CheY-like chemotaxis protein
MKILIIDDDRKFARSLQERLEMLSNIVDFRLTPDGGKEMADATRNYDIIFIDFRYKEQAKSGADIAVEIRKQHPLSALILMTAWGNEEIKNYIYVGFDNFLSKYDEGEGADLKRMIAEYHETVEKAFSNAQLRCKSIFDENELMEMTSYLDAVDDTINFLENNGGHSIINSYSIAAGVCLLRQNKKLDKLILQDMATVKDRAKTKKKHKIFSYNYLSSDVFELKSSTGGYKENALKIRQLLSSTRNKWEKARGLRVTGRPYYRPIYDIVKEFDIS